MSDTTTPKQGNSMLQTLITVLVTVLGSYGAITSHIDATIASEVQRAKVEMRDQVDEVTRIAKQWHTQAQEWHRRDSIAIADLERQLDARKGRRREERTF